MLSEQIFDFGHRQGIAGISRNNDLFKLGFVIEPLCIAIHLAHGDDAYYFRWHNALLAARADQARSKDAQGQHGHKIRGEVGNP